MAPFLNIGTSLALLIATSSAKKLLFEETISSSLPPIESREFLLNRPNWLGIIPECEDATIRDEAHQEGDGAWSITANNGSHILCTNTVKSDRCFEDKFDGCYLSYNVKVTTVDGVKFTFDIEYDLKHGSVRRAVRGFETIGLKSKVFKPLIKGPLIELMREENRRMARLMNPRNPSQGSILHSSQG